MQATNKRPDVAARKRRNKDSITRTVKCCLAPTTAGRRGPVSLLGSAVLDGGARPKVPFCVYSEIAADIESAVVVMSELRIRANILAELWLRRCVDAGVRPVIDQNNFFVTALRSCLEGCGIRNYRKKASTDPVFACLVDAYEGPFVSLFSDVPGGYADLKMPTGTGEMVPAEALTMATNHATYIERTLMAHVVRYAMLKLERTLPSPQTTGKRRASLAVVVKRAIGSAWSTDGAPKVHERSVETILPRFPRIAEAAAPHTDAIQRVVDDLWDRLSECGPMPLDVRRASKNAGDYAAFRLHILGALETEVDRVRTAVEADAIPKAATDEDVEECELESEELDALLPRKTQRPRRKLAFALLPVLKYRAAYVSVVPSVLRNMLRRYKNVSAEATTILRLTEGDDASLFAWVFNVGRVRAPLGAGKWTVVRVATDGVGCSVTLQRAPATPAEAADVAVQNAKSKRKKLAAERSKAAVEEARATFAAGGFRRIVGVDDGKKAVVTVAEHSDTDVVERPGAARHAMTTVSGREYRFEMGFDRRMGLTKSWTATAPAVAAFNAAALSPRTADTTRYEAAAKVLVDALPALADFYVTRRRFRRLRFGTYARGQRGLQRMADKVLSPASGVGSRGQPTALKQQGEEKDVLVGWENASFNGVKGCAAAGPGRLKKVVAARATLVDVDAYRNSKVCSHCHAEMKGLPLHDLRDAFQNVVRADGSRLVLNTVSDKIPLLSRTGQRVRSYTVRLCTSETCHRMLFNRDTNAAINVRAKLLMMLHGVPFPDVWTRGTAVV